MCGICGIYGFGSGVFSDELSLKKMTDALKRRGPDAEGFWRRGPVALGHRRLKVIDLEFGAQPMTSRDGSATLVFNGEIYNFQEIRANLEKKGRQFKTKSDTESLLALYEEKGIDCARELKGMFAFSVYDEKKRALYLAVDRFGKKPIYYTQSDGVFLFASELKSLLTHPKVRKKIDVKALSQFLAFEYIPSPCTIFQDIFKLEPATYLTVTEEGIQKKRYWRHDHSIEQKGESEWQKDLFSGLRDAVSKRLVSDVPLGIFLSGGLDSSAIAAIARDLCAPRKIKTFTMEFDEVSFDESRYAKSVSDYLGTEYISQKFLAKDLLDEQDEILSYLDEPYADASFLPTYLLCRLAKKHVTVALSGDGGDELFAGYPTFFAHRLGQSLDRLPPLFLKTISGVARHMPVSFNNLSADFKLKQFVKGMAYRDFYRDQVWLGSFSPREAISVFSPQWQNEAKSSLDILDEELQYTVTMDSFQALQAFYFRFYLSGDILVKMDRASMANSLEVRSPFLDDDFVEKMLRVPPFLKLRNLKSKYLLKQAMKGKLPQNVIDRRKKGFGIPIAQWIREDLKNEFTSVLSAKEINKDGYFNGTEIERFLNEHLEGKKDNRKKLWALYIFQKWKKRWAI